MAERDRSKQQLALKKRMDAARGKQIYEQDEADRLNKISTTRQVSLLSRVNASKAQEQLRRQKQLDAGNLDKNLAQQVAEEESKTLLKNKAKRLDIFHSRYAGAKDATMYDNSTYRKLYAMDHVSEEEIEQANRVYFQKIHHAPSKTDDDMDTEAAAVARKQLALESKSRKKMEAERIAAENAEMWERLQKVEKVLDDEMDDDAAYVARAKVAQQVNARKERERDALKRSNAEMQRRLKAVQSKTDADITDEGAGAMRKQMAVESQARKAEEEALREQQNREMREKIQTTVAAVDDDVGDEVAGVMRAELAKQSKAKKAEADAKLKADNKGFFGGIFATKAAVDDDIGDETAGMAREGYDIHHRDDGQIGKEDEDEDQTGK